jgi:hypothetical protein
MLILKDENEKKYEFVVACNYIMLTPNFIGISPGALKLRYARRQTNTTWPVYAN